MTVAATADRNDYAKRAPATEPEPQIGVPANAGPAGLVSVVIPCCGQMEYTKLCVASLLRHTRKPFELVFLDIGSLDGTREFLAGVALAAAVRVESARRGHPGLFLAWAPRRRKQPWLSPPAAERLNPRAACLSSRLRWLLNCGRRAVERTPCAGASLSSEQPSISFPLSSLPSPS